jgi:succinate dehydrogenase flavin-adding protein (antitoxin of CptAB toxin-antitoxin module)
MGNREIVPRTESSSQNSDIETMLNNFQAYCNADYNQTQKSILMQYLGCLDPKILRWLYPETLKVKRFGSPLPMVEHFEEAMPRARAKMEDERQSPYNPNSLFLPEETGEVLSREEISRRLKDCLGSLLGSKIDNLIGGKK